MKKHVLKFLRKKVIAKRHEILYYLRKTGYPNVTTRDLSKVLNEITVIDGLIIKSSGSGIKLAKNEKEAHEAIAYYRSYAFSYLRKAKIAKRNLQRFTAKLFNN